MVSMYRTGGSLGWEDENRVVEERWIKVAERPKGSRDGKFEKGKRIMRFGFCRWGEALSCSFDATVGDYDGGIEGGGMLDKAGELHTRSWQVIVVAHRTARFLGMFLHHINYNGRN